MVLEELQRMAKENKGLVDLWCKIEVFHLDFCQKKSELNELKEEVR